MKTTATKGQDRTRAIVVVDDNGVVSRGELEKLGDFFFFLTPVRCQSLGHKGEKEADEADMDH